MCSCVDCDRDRNRDCDLLIRSSIEQSIYALEIRLDIVYQLESGAIVLQYSGMQCTRLATSSVVAQCRYKEQAYRQFTYTYTSSFTPPQRLLRMGKVRKIILILVTAYVLQT